MQSNTATKYANDPITVPRANIANDNARRIMARARYQAPSVASYPISGCDQAGPVSMIGNQGPQPL